MFWPKGRKRVNLATIFSSRKFQSSMIFSIGSSIVISLIIDPPHPSSGRLCSDPVRHRIGWPPCEWLAWRDDHAQRCTTHALGAVAGDTDRVAPEELIAVVTGPSGRLGDI